MRLEEVLPEMRKGREAAVRQWRYRILSDTFQCWSYACKNWVSEMPPNYLALCADWSIVPEPPPLPKLFRAKRNGVLVSGAYEPGSYDAHRVFWPETLRGWYSETQLTDITYIDPNGANP